MEVGGVALRRSTLQQLVGEEEGGGQVMRLVCRVRIRYSHVSTHTCASTEKDGNECLPLTAQVAGIDNLVLTWQRMNCPAGSADVAEDGSDPEEEHRFGVHVSALCAVIGEVRHPGMGGGEITAYRVSGFQGV